ncbi:MAG TPA: hypothetical protein VKA54_01260 [Gemmatimonadaceae bacterium]|nr:hypothetical protein [Gemmatimonadaceae bacterium]
MTDSTRSRLDAWLPALLFLAGSALFLGAGRHHPQINASLGEVGSPQFYRAFAAHMLHMPNWGSVHLGILLGPVLWALAASGAARLLPARASSLGDLARSALMLAAGLWSIAFVLDGFAGPKLATAIAAAEESADADTIRAFSVNQLTMARLGMLSVALVGASMVAFGGALLIDGHIRSWRSVVGALGLVSGAWPVVAAMRGEFFPGPFTSPWWTIMALVIGFWFLLFGTVVPRLDPRGGLGEPA